MQISKIESNCLGSVSTLSKYYSLLNEEHGTTFMLSRTGNKRQFMSLAHCRLVGIVALLLLLLLLKTF